MNCTVVVPFGTVFSRDSASVAVGMVHYTGKLLAWDISTLPVPRPKA